MALASKHLAVFQPHHARAGRIYPNQSPNSADDLEPLLLPEIERQQKHGKEVAVSGQPAAAGRKNRASTAHPEAV